MVKAIRNLFSKEIGGIYEAAYLLAIFSVISQAFALIRDRLLASYFGTGIELDIYYAAFKLPDLLFVFVSTLVSVSVLVPYFVKHLEKQSELKKIVNSVFTILSVFSIVLLVISFYFVPKFLQLIVPNLFNSVYQEELILITKIILIQPIILSISSFVGSLVQAYRKFIIYAISPILYNVGIIIGIVYFYPKYGLNGLAYGVVLGSIMHLLFQIPFLFEKSIYPRITFDINFREVLGVVLNSIPRTVSMLSNQATLIFMTFMASSMSYGSLSTFNLSFNLQSVPLAIIGVSYSLAVFPALSKYFHENDFNNFYVNLNKAIKHIIFWSLPVMAMFIVLRAQIVRVILGSGNFDWNATKLVAASLAIFTISIFAQSISLLMLRAYYSMTKTLKPFFITALSFVVTIILSIYFMNVLNSDLSGWIKILLRLEGIENISVLALPIAYSIGQLIYVLLLIVSFGNIDKFINVSLFKTISQSLSASLLAFVVSFISLNFLDKFFDINTFWGIFSQGFLSGIFGLASAFIFLIVIGNTEAKVVLNTVHNKFWKTKPLSPEVEEEI